MSDIQGKIDKMVAMTLMGCSGREIAETFGIDDSRVSQIKATELFKDTYAKEASKHHEEHKAMNDSWDAIEKKGLEIVGDTLRRTQDPEYALKAAMLANRAARRGGINNTPIAAQGQGKVAIAMQATFIQSFQQIVAQQLQDFGGSVRHDTETGVSKRTNLLAPNEVTKIFTISAPSEVDSNAA